MDLIFSLMPLKHIAIVSMEHKFQKDVIIVVIASALLLFNKRKIVEQTDNAKYQKVEHLHVCLYCMLINACQPSLKPFLM